MKIPLLDLKAQYHTIKDEVDRAVMEVIESQYFILGPTVTDFENRVAEYCKCKHAVGVTSGSDALLLALMALGVGPGDEVIVPTYTFFATAGSVARLGAKPVFVDIEAESFNIDVNCVEKALTPKTKAVIPVHLYGQCAEMDPLLKLASDKGIAVIEDAAQAIGSEYRGRRAGTMGTAGCFSFFPSKNLGGFGDGGMIVTDDDDLAERLRIMRVHGSKPKYYHKMIGGNFRLDALQAAVLNVKLGYLDEWSEARQGNADTYDRLFNEAKLVPEKVSLPVRIQERHIFNQYVIRVGKRDELKAFLCERGVSTEIYYPVPLHLQECFADLGGKEGDCPVAEQAAASTLALPIYPELTEEQKSYVVENIAQFYR